MSTAPKVDEKFDSYGGYSMNQEVYFLHPEASWIRGQVTEIRAIAKRGGFAEVCFGVTATLNPVQLPNITAANATIFPLRDAEVHHVVASGTSSMEDDGTMSSGTARAMQDFGIVCPNTVHDLLQLSYLHDSTLLEQVRSRYFSTLIYTHIGPIVLALNPYDFHLKQYVDSNLPRYFAEGNAVVTKGASENLPHAWTTAHYAYWRMSTDRKNQSVIVSGESGAGKTETAKIVVRYLGKVSTTQCSEELRMEAEQITNKVNITSPILEAFGNAKTKMNDNSSRFGKFMKVHFRQQGSGGGAVMVGSAIEVYLLEKSRIVTHGEGERAYHSFYQLLADLPPSSAPAVSNFQAQVTRKRSLKDRGELTTAQDYASLCKGGATVIPGVDDGADFCAVEHAMQVLGLSDAERDSTWEVVGAILHLVMFLFAAPSEDSSAIDSKCSAHVAAVASLLQIDTELLTKEFTTTTMVTRGETMVKTLRKTLAMDLRDALCKTLYESLFLWLVEKINTLIAAPEFSPSSPTHGRNLDAMSWIALLDIFGFENFSHGNSFEQLCINLANETLQNHYNTIVFTRDMAECQAEGINTESVVFYDNQPCLDLLCGVNFSNCGVAGGTAVATNRLSIFGLLDESCSLQSGTDATLCTKIGETYGGRSSDGQGAHSNFIRPKTQQNAFCIIHYAGEVKYTIDGFRSKNADTLKESLKDVIRSSRNEFIADLLPVSAASPTTNSGPSKKATVGGFFKSQLISLMTEINGTHPHWIRCVKPHSAKRPRMFHGMEVMNQLRYAGVLETVRLRQQSYAIRMPHEEFCQKHRVLLGRLSAAVAGAVRTAGGDVTAAESAVPAVDLPLFAAKLPAKGDTASWQQCCTEILRRTGLLRHELAQVGHTKVFLRTKAFFALSQSLRAANLQFTRELQVAARAYQSRRRVRCLWLNQQVRMLQAAGAAYLSDVHTKQLELAAKTKELLTKFRLLMILQTEESKVRLDTIEVARDAYFTNEFIPLFEKGIVDIRIAWEAKKQESDAAARVSFGNDESTAREELQQLEWQARGVLLELTTLDENEEQGRHHIVAEEQQEYETSLVKERDLLDSEWAAYQLAQYLAIERALTDAEVVARSSVEQEESALFECYTTVSLFEQREVQQRSEICETETNIFATFPVKAAKFLQDLKDQWLLRKGARDKHALLSLQLEEQQQRQSMQQQRLQQLAAFMEEANQHREEMEEWERRRVVQEERDRLAIAIEERRLQEAEEFARWEEVRERAQAAWRAAETELQLQQAVDREAGIVAALKAKKMQLIREHMMVCRHAELRRNGAKAAGRGVGSTSSVRANPTTNSALEYLRSAQVELQRELDAHEGALMQAQWEQQRGGGGSSSPSLLPPQSTRRSISPRDLGPLVTIQDATPTTIISSPTPAVKMSASHTTSSMDLLQRLNVVQKLTTAQTFRSIGKGEEELIPLIDSSASLRSGSTPALNKLERFHAAKQRRQLELSAQRPLIRRTSVSPGQPSSPSPDRTTRSAAAAMTLPSVVAASHHSSPPLTTTTTVRRSPPQPLFVNRANKNPFSDTWHPAQPVGGGDPGMLYTYLPDGRIVCIGPMPSSVSTACEPQHDDTADHDPTGYHNGHEDSRRIAEADLTGASGDPLEFSPLPTKPMVV